MSPTSSSFEAEALRINERYLRELVEAFDICPFAQTARERGEVDRRVIRGATFDVEASLHAASEAGPTIRLLLYPELDIDFAQFDALAAELRTRATGGPYALAPFHPDAPYAADTPAKLVMFFRRAPDPTIQLVRFSALQAVKGANPTDKKFLFEWSAKGLAELERRASTEPLSERIARENFEMIAREGVPRLEGILADIRADRAASYARFR